MSNSKFGGKPVIIAIIAVVVIALLVVGIKVIVPMQKYNSAVSLMEDGKYVEAMAAFEQMDGYKDSADKILQCKYDYALAMMADGKYSDAIDLLSTLDSADSKARIKECEIAIADAKYNEALELMAKENYIEAGNILKTLNYKDSADKFEECKTAAPYELTEIGDIISFGCYEQDNNRDNGLEPLEWRVLDKEDGKVFVISDKAVEMLPYFAIYWKRSHIGGWLNNSFIKDFTPEEKAMIVETTVTADSHPDKPETDQGADTEHGLYLLSVDEVLEYFPEPEDRICYATDYLISEFEGTIHVNGLYEGGRCDWWLRTALHNYSSGAFIANIDPNGNVNASTHNCRHALRPVCWLQLEG